MVYYLVRRLLLSMLVILATAIFLAALVHLIPGDPVTLILGPRATAAKSAQVRSEMELDKSVAQQVTNFVWRAARGDLGRDFASGRSVTSILAVALPHTGILAVVSLALAALIGLPLGVYSATHPHSWTDRLTAILAISFITMPSYLAGQFLLLIFAVYLGWLPAIGTGELSDPVDYLRHLLLPAVALAVTWIGYLARLVRASMLEVLSANYIRTALAYGLSDRVIYYRHALKNALIPTIAVLGVGLGNLLGGAVFMSLSLIAPVWAACCSTPLQHAIPNPAPLGGVALCVFASP